jgi:START domain-containing protein
MLVKLKFSYPFFICLFLLTNAISIFAQDNWVLKKEKDGIKVSSRPSAYSKFNALKIETDLTGNVSQLAAILLDVEKYTEWAYATKTCVLIKKISDNEIIYYSEIDVPWPATNRDFYADFKVVLDTVTRSVKVTSFGLKDYQPEKKDLVRIPMSKGVWNITTISDKTIHLEYILEVNPGGSVPAWILNMFATKGPLETFENLKQKMLLLNS